MSNEMVEFKCNICGSVSQQQIEVVSDREKPSCELCGSNLRFRTIAAVVSQKLYGQIKPVSAFVVDKSINGLGMSDAHIYATPFKRLFNYKNTYYHKSPKLDILSPDDKWTGFADFVISTDVFEHVPQPLEKAFQNLRKLIKPGGFCVFSVPYSLREDTIEHFPELHEYSIVEKQGKKILINVKRNGEKQVIDSGLCFHGGDGSTLELRIFSRSDLIARIEHAGFEQIHVHEEEFPHFGIINKAKWSLVVSMHNPSS